MMNEAVLRQGVKSSNIYRKLLDELIRQVRYFRCAAVTIRVILETL